ncbi:MAG: hypothetical protein ACRDFX_04430 [Chloroflexota bacterium]
MRLALKLTVGTLLGALGLGLWLASSGSILAPARAQTGLPVSGNVSSVPQAPSIDLTYLPEGETKIPASEAVRIAMKRFALTRSQLDTRVGVVRALVNVKEDPLKRNLKSWIVTADVEFDHAVPGGPAIVFHTLSIVVNAITGRYEFGYFWTPGT